MSKIKCIDCQHGKSDNCDGCSIYEFAESKAKENVVSKPDPSSESFLWPDTSSQSAKADAGKPKLSLVPSQIIWDIAEVREYGNKKYPDGGKDNWKRVEMERYVDALYRHFLAFIDNPFSKDAESGIPHYKHMACNMAFISWMMGECNIPEFLEKDLNIPKGEYLITDVEGNVIGKGKVPKDD